MVATIPISQLIRRTRNVLVGGVKAARYALEAVRLQALLAWRPGTQTPPPWDEVWDRLDKVTDRLVILLLTVPPLTFLAMWFIGWLGADAMARLPLVAASFILVTQSMRYLRFVCPRCGRRFNGPGRRPRSSQHCCQHCGLKYRQSH